MTHIVQYSENMELKLEKGKKKHLIFIQRPKNDQIYAI